MDMNLNYSVKNLLVMQYTPTMNKFHNKGRTTSAFLHINAGHYRYKTEDGVKEAKTGDTVYLPVFSDYSYKILSEHTECIYAEFILDVQDGDGEYRTEKICKSPFVLKNRQPELRSLFHSLSTNFLTNRFAATGDLYKILSILKQAVDYDVESTYFRKIAPAVLYVQQNYTQKIYTDQLAQLCGLSPSHMRRLFIEKIGLSPIKYKNFLTMQAACALLKSDSLNISEVASALNFPDIYTFSQAFKKEIGVSPKKYADGKE